VWIIGLIAAILTAFYMSRWFFLIFLGEPRYGHDVHPHESPRSMTIPLIVLGVLSTVGGVALNPVHTGPLYRFLEPTVGPIGDLGYEPYGPLEESVLIPLAIIAAVIGIGLAYLLYLRRPVMGARTSEPITGPLAELAERRFFVDEAYEALFVTAGGGWPGRWCGSTPASSTGSSTAPAARRSSSAEGHASPSPGWSGGTWR
jgi:NADH-quinone oxidoreductase subunit L